MTDQPASNPVEGKALAAQLEQARKALRDIDMAVCGLCEYPDVPPHPRDVVERVTILVAEREDLAVDLAKSDTELANAQGALSRDKAEILKAFAKFRDGARSRTDAAERLRDEALNAKIAAQTAAGCLRAERDAAVVRAEGAEGAWTDTIAERDEALAVIDPPDVAVERDQDQIVLPVRVLFRPDEDGDQ